MAQIVNGELTTNQRQPGVGGYGNLPPMPAFLTGAGGSGGSSSGSGGSGAGGGTLGGPSNALTNNTYTMSPDLKGALDALKARSSTDDTVRATNRATTGAMDAAALQAADLKGSLAGRGLIGGGTAGAAFLNKNVYAPAQRSAAQAASNIALGQQQRLDTLAQAGVNAAAVPEQLSLANRNLGLEQWQAQQSDALAQQDLANRIQQQQVAQWQALLEAA